MDKRLIMDWDDDEEEELDFGDDDEDTDPGFFGAPAGTPAQTQGPTDPNGNYNPFIDPKVGTGYSGWAPARTGGAGTTHTPNGNPDPFGAPPPPVAKEPKDNQGRDKCFWCGSPTKKVPGLMQTYDVCTKCGR